MNPTSTNVSSPSTSTQSRLPTSFSPFRNQFSQSAQSCCDSDLESTRKDSQNSQDSTHFSQTLPSQVQMYYPNSFPSNSASKQDFSLFSEDNTLPIAYNCSRKKIQSLNEIESKDDLAVRMVNRQREILLNNRASTSTALQPIAEKAETPRNDGSDITESSSPQSTRQDLQYLQDNDLLKKYDESERESQGKLSCTTTPLSAKSMFPTSFFGSSNPVVPLQNFNSSSCINLSTNLAKPDSNKPNLPPLSVPSKMNGTTTSASRDLFAEFNNEKSDEDTTPQNFKMMQNKFLPKRTVSDNNISTLFNKKDEPAKSAQKILNPSTQKVFDFGQNLRTTQHCYSALLKPKSQYADYGDDDEEDDGAPGFIAKLKNNLLPVKSNPNPDAFRPTKAFTDFPQASTFGSQPEHNTSFGSHFQPAPPKIFGTLGGCTSALLGPKTATKLFDSDDEEEEMKTTSITNFKSVPLNSRAATENILPRLGNKLNHLGSFAVAPTDLNTSHNASKVLDFDDDDHDPAAKSQCASALIKTKETKTLFSEFGNEEQELKTKGAKPSKSPFAIGRSNSENAIPSFAFNKAPFTQSQNTSTAGKLLLDPSTPVASNTAHNESTRNIFSENNPLLAQLKADKITSTPHSADHQFSSDPSKNDFRPNQVSQFGPNPLKMQRSATVVTLPPNSIFFQRSGSFRHEFYLSEPPSRFDCDYDIVDVLGQGTFMRVLLCEHVLDRQLYVVKCSHQRFNALDDEDNITQTLNKVQAMTSGNSEDPNHHVVRYYNSWKEDGNLYVVMEYCEGGNLTQLNLGGAEKSESEIRKILLDICTALRPLHKKKAVHLHIKPENILLSKAGKYKLGDFGLSNLDYQAKLGNLEGDTVDKDLENAMYYFGPELLDDEHCGVRTLDLTKADIYSFGLCLAEFILGVNFRENKEIMDELKEGDFSKLRSLKNYSEELKETIESMLSQQPENRPSAEYILQQYARNDAQEIQQEKQENKKLRATVDHLKKQLGLKRKKSL